MTTFCGLLGEIVSISTPENVIGWLTAKIKGETVTVSTVAQTGDATRPRIMIRNVINSKVTFLGIASHTRPCFESFSICEYKVL